jgi:hypothetical protein
MRTLETRIFNCKDEELPAICKNAGLCLRRDLLDFTAFSPVFNENYIDEFEKKINLVDELVCSKTETNELKNITRRLHETMDSLVEPTAKIRNCLFVTKKTIGLSAKDFGLAMLSRKISDRNAEGTRKNLLHAITFLENHREQLATAGFNDDIIEQFRDALSSITEDNERQINIVRKRKAIVQKNMPVLNDLYAQLTYILNTGKAVYKGVNIMKYKEYSINSLKKSVRRQIGK